ncbi:IS66 family transposase zinc-finger binding domain-containing protein [Pseudomonas sp. CJQ_13]|uniref:IS66 family transposase zinc-finger binding domain-containing protein n=1 Tax=Pseudomonas sp. CJQ_13 TaxID=3367170 RepID=UPI00370CC522
MVGEETSEQVDIVPMQIRVLKHVRKVCGCRGGESAPVTADEPTLLIEKSMPAPACSHAADHQVCRWLTGCTVLKT